MLIQFGDQGGGAQNGFTKAMVNAEIPSAA